MTYTGSCYRRLKALRRAADFIEAGKLAPLEGALNGSGEAVPFFSPEARNFGLFAAIDRAVMAASEEERNHTASLREIAAEAERVIQLFVCLLDMTNGIHFPCRATDRETVASWAKGRARKEVVEALRR